MTSIIPGLPAATTRPLRPLPTPTGPSGDRGATLEFARVLGTSDRGLAGKATGTREADARQAAEDLVSITLVEPLLKMAREANSAEPPFGPGDGEQTFGGILDATYAREIVRSAQFPLVDRLARDMLNRLSPGTDAGATDRSPGTES